MPEWTGTVLLLLATGLGAVVIEEKIAPLPKWTGPLFLYVVMPLLYIILVGAIAVAYGYL
jgi:hypothetical protein